MKPILVAATAIAVCSISAAPALAAEIAQQFVIPGGSLADALDAYARQTGVQLVYKTDEVRASQSPGVRGAFGRKAALDAILKGTGFAAHSDPSGAIAIVRSNLPAGAAASGQPATSGIVPNDEQTAIVVTGTNIRSGPQTSPVLTITRRDIERTGATSVDEFMRKLPQNVSQGVAKENFAIGGTGGSDITDQGSGINLRGLGQRATLVLVNGRRLAPSGIGAFVDVSMIPITAIDRVDVLTDGASAIYGSDAVAGVVNFVLRNDFRGVETSAQLGTTTRGGGDEYLLGVTAGTGWGGGNALISYEFRDEKAILARQRPFSTGFPADWSLFPKERRHSVYGTLNQEIAPRLHLDVSGIFADRRTDRSFFQGGVVLPVDVHAVARLYGGTAALDYDLGHSWRVEANASYFHSRSDETSTQTGPGGGLFNLSNNLNTTREFGLKVDGSLFDLPGGPVRLAVGGTARREHLESAFATQVNTPTLQIGSRRVEAAYGELSVPLFSDANRRPGFERLLLNGAVRAENYQGIGSSVNPKLGVLWSPGGGFDIRSSWGTSFRAPLLYESLGLYNVFLFPTALLYLDPAGAPPGVGAALIGSNPNVKPETSRSFALSVSWHPPATRQLNLKASYYSISFSNRIAFPSDQIVVIGDPALESIVTRNPGVSSVTSIFDGANQVLDFSGPGFTNGNATPADVVNIVDVRSSNTAQTRTSGLDVGASYGLELGANTFNFDLNVNKVFRFDDRLTPSSPVIHTLDTPYHPIKLRGRAGLSWMKGPFGAFLFANYTDSYTDRRRLTPTKVNAWTTFDGGLALTLPKRSGAQFSGLRVGLNVENLFDKRPPRLAPDPGSTKGLGYDPVNASGRGRVISLQLRKSW